MAAAVTTVQGIYLKIAWTAPNTNGAAITAYKILIRDSTGTYLEES
jgi:hypothetical protein